MISRYTGTGTLADSASSITVFLGTVTDNDFLSGGRPVIDHGVVWVLYATGVEAQEYGCGLPDVPPTTCTPFVREKLVELVNPVTGAFLDATEY